MIYSTSNKMIRRCDSNISVIVEEPSFQELTMKPRDWMHTDSSKESLNFSPRNSNRTQRNRNLLASNGNQVLEMRYQLKKLKSNVNRSYNFKTIDRY